MSERQSEKNRPDSCESSLLHEQTLFPFERQIDFDEPAFGGSAIGFETKAKRANSAALMRDLFIGQWRPGRRRPGQMRRGQIHFFFTREHSIQNRRA